MAGRSTDTAARRARLAVLASLDSVGKVAGDRFTGPASRDRLLQLNDHLGTVRMVVEALFDEDDRHTKGT
jgi:hypothetical protein